MEVELTTRSGDHVITLTIPTFKFPPEIIVWGERHFARYLGPAGHLVTDVRLLPGRPIYREAFAYFAAATRT